MRATNSGSRSWTSISPDGNKTDNQTTHGYAIAETTPQVLKQCATT
jgi:hypothetical protein